VTSPNRPEIEELAAKVVQAEADHAVWLERNQRAAKAAWRRGEPLVARVTVPAALLGELAAELAEYRTFGASS
jgi:hypothetical protein